jgi:hypothetical protein
MQKGPAVDARWIPAAPHSAVSFGGVIVANIELIAGTRAPQFGVDSFMVFVGNTEPGKRDQLRGTDFSVAVVHPVSNWAEPIQVDLLSGSISANWSRVGTLRIDDLRLTVPVYRRDSTDHELVR